jgi:carboxypeptidase Q
VLFSSVYALMSRKTLCILLLLLVPALVIAQEQVDLSVINRIKTEAFTNSKATEYLFQLTDVNGPRLANSPGYKSAADWCVKTLQEIGVTNPHLEKWGPLGRGWTYSYYAGHMIEPSYSPIIGAPVAWTPGTNGPVTGEAIMASIQSPADFEKYKGKLKGKMALISQPRDLQMPSTAFGSRYNNDDLNQIAMLPIPGAAGGRGGRGPTQPAMTPEQQRQFQADLLNFWKAEQPAMLIQNSSIGEGGTVAGGGARQRDSKDNPPTVVISTEQYNRIARLLTHNPAVPVKLQFEVKAQYIDDAPVSYNVVGEIPGGAKKDEVVMVGGHLDSWHYGTGATDNAIGVAVAIETMRILKALDLKMARTVRVGLWDAEEEGLLGSAAYVKEHFADRATMKTTAEHAKLAGYFNIDNGGGKIRGIYTQGNDMVKPIFEKWLEPFKDLGATTVTVRNTGGTDHQSFDAVGLPGFQFIQDPLDYDARTHHTNMDVYDRLQRADILQMAAIEAAFVYQAATRPEMLPRKPMPKPAPAGGRGGGN